MCSGSFLADYYNKSNLHIAVTDSEGEVLEYDSRGVTRGSLSWGQCLVIALQEVAGWNQYTLHLS